MYKFSDAKWLTVFFKTASAVVGFMIYVKARN